MQSRHITLRHCSQVRSPVCCDWSEFSLQAPSLIVVTQRYHWRYEIGLLWERLSQLVDIKAVTRIFFRGGGVTLSLSAVGALSVLTPKTPPPSYGLGLYVVSVSAVASEVRPVACAYFTAGWSVLYHSIYLYYRIYTNVIWEFFAKFWY